MIFLESISNTLGTFPDTTGKNASGGAATDGTPWIRSFIDNYFGLSQALLDAAGMTPDAATDVHDACQQLDALRYVSGPIGTPAGWFGNDDESAADPSALGIRLLPLTGQGILRTSYPDLDAVVYVGDTANPTADAFYHATDAGGTTRNPSGAYLILPDARGQTFRGLDISGTVDPDGASRAVGDIQADSLQRHWHELKTDSTNYGAYRTSFIGGGVTFGFASATSPPSEELIAKSVISDAAAATVKTNYDETRMTNIAVRWCIWY